MKDLEGRVALVTGGARGIGAATAKELAEVGARVVIGDIGDGTQTAEALPLIIRGLRDRGLRFTTLPA